MNSGQQDNRLPETAPLRPPDGPWECLLSGQTGSRRCAIHLARITQLGHSRAVIASTFNPATTAPDFFFAARQRAACTIGTVIHDSAQLQNCHSRSKTSENAPSIALLCLR